MSTAAPALSAASVRAAAVLRPLPPGPEGRPRIGPADFTRAAALAGATDMQLRAVVLTEIGQAGGFLSDGSGRARALYEAHVFGRETGHRWDRSHPTLSRPAWDRSLYRGGAAEYDRIEAAAELEAAAALRSASYGLGQILGLNYALCGFADVFAFVAAQQRGEPEQLETFVAFLKGSGLADELRAVSADPAACAPLARGYNGSGYAVQGYHVKLAANFATLAGAGVPPSIAGMVRIGQTGPAVVRVQKALNLHSGRPPILADGIFGRGTEIAVQQFQVAHALRPDGVVGPITAKALGIG